MSFDQIMAVITEHGMSVVLMAYFLIKDWKCNTQIINTLTEVKEVLTAMRALLPFKRDGE